MRCALIIGSAKYYDPKLARLSAPVADIRGLAEVLRAPDIGGFDEVTTLLDQAKADTEREVAEFFQEKKRDDLLLLYFSGHGVLNERGRLFLAFRDTSYRRLTATAISAVWLTEEMDSSPSRRQILILDCCHSGAFARGAKGDARAITEATFEGNGYGRVVLTATDATQFALEGEQVLPEVQTSLFTHYLLQGLRTGEADRSPHDGKITLDEWYDYAYDQVMSQTPAQTPRKWSYNQQGELLIAGNPLAEVRQAALPPDLLHALESPFAQVRSGAVDALAQLLRGSDASLARAARTALERMCQDDSRTVSSMASQYLGDSAGRQVAIEKREQKASDRPKLSQNQTLMRSMDWRFWLKWVGGWSGACGLLLLVLFALNDWKLIFGPDYGGFPELAILAIVSLSCSLISYQGYLLHFYSILIARNWARFNLALLLTVILDFYLAEGLAIFMCAMANLFGLPIWVWWVCRSRRRETPPESQ